MAPSFLMPEGESQQAEELLDEPLGVGSSGSVAEACRALDQN
jgi:hypothetical protein